MEIIQLWDEIPGYEEGHHSPYLKYFRSENKKGNGTVVILPGGGYAMRAAHEGDGYAELLNGFGLDCFVLEYRVSPTRFPYPLLDARRAMRYVRANAEKYGIDPQKIAIMGSSAGGHLAAALGSLWDHDEIEQALSMPKGYNRPTGTVLAYPVITGLEPYAHRGSINNILGRQRDLEEARKSVSLELLVSEKTVPAFLWAARTDDVVPVQNTLLYGKALADGGVPFEMHIYPRGGHGVATANHITGCPYTEMSAWMKESVRWMQQISQK